MQICPANWWEARRRLPTDSHRDSNTLQASSLVVASLLKVVELPIPLLWKEPGLLWNRRCRWHTATDNDRDFLNVLPGSQDPSLPDPPIVRIPNLWRVSALECPQVNRAETGSGHIFLRYFPLIQGVSLIRFFKIRGHLSQNLSIRNSHIYRKFKFFKNRVTNESSGFLGRDVVRRNGRIVHITFIDADLFDVGADTRQMFHKHLAFQTVHIMIRRSHDQMRTFAQGIDHRFTGSDAESLGGNGFGRTTPCLVEVSPPTMEGIVRRSTGSPVPDGPAPSGLKKKAELTSI